jgi:death-on-curing protein
MTVCLSEKIILALHDEQLAEHGGASGLRDPGLLESALAWPVNHAAYATPDTAELAATYAIGIARNRPFIDGNKRAAFAAMLLFLSLNGLPLRAPEVEATAMALRMAAGDADDAEFTAWVRDHAVLKT